MLPANHCYVICSGFELCFAVNCDLHIRVREDGYKSTPITVEGFAFMWAGVRATYGLKKGKVAYECKVLEHLNVDHLPDEERTRHVVRVGFSTDECSMQLGTICYQLSNTLLYISLFGMTCTM